MSEALNIYQRLDAVRSKVEYIKKDKEVKGQGYKAVEHDAVTAAIRPAFIEHGIVIVPEETSSVVVDTESFTKTGTRIIRFEAKYNIHFINIDNPEDRSTVVLTAHALDHGDKAPGKAMSYATKTAILKILSIETGESDEKRVDNALPYTQEQAERFNGLLTEGNGVEFFALTNSLTPEAQIALFNSFPKGEKTKMKAKARTLEAEGVKVIGEYVTELSKAADNDDAVAVGQLTGEMSFDVKRTVWGMLEKEHRDKITSMKAQDAA